MRRCRLAFMLTFALILVGCSLPLAAASPSSSTTQVTFISDRLSAVAAMWQPVDGPKGSPVVAFALSPDYSHDRTIFAGVYGRGVYRSIDGGLSWALSSPPDWPMVDLAISPAFATDRALFAAFGFRTSGYSVYRSTDGGDSWQPPSSMPYAGDLPGITGLAISPNFAADHTLYVLGLSATYRSTDGGSNFAQAGGWFAGRDVVDLAFSPAYATDQTMFAIVRCGGLYKSIDRGVTWMPVSLTGCLSAVAVSPDYANDRMVAAVDADDGRLYISADRGATWSPRSIVLGGVTGDHTLLFSPTFATDRIMFAASRTDAGAYRSADGGATWSPVGWYDPAQSYRGGFVGGSVYALVIPPYLPYDPVAFAGTTSGLYRSSNQGENWSQANQALPRLTVRAIKISPNAPGTLLAGTAYLDRALTATPVELDGNLQLSLDGGDTWRVVSERLDQIHQIAFSPGFASDATTFAVAGYSDQSGYSGGGVYRSTDGGQNWRQVASGVYRALAVSPNYSVDRTAWVYRSGPLPDSGIFVSTDGGDTWTLLSASAFADVAIAPSPNYAVDQTLFAGASGAGLQKSTDAGVHWTQVLTHEITALAVSPAYGASRTIYVGVRETSGAPGELYRSTDGGATWQKLNTGIPKTQAGKAATLSALTFAADGSVLAGVHYGSNGGVAYRSADGGQTWSPIADGLGDFNLFALASTSNRRDVEPHGALSIYAGTDGGLWRREIAQADPDGPGIWMKGEIRGGRAQVLALSPNFVNDGIAFSGEWQEPRPTWQYGRGIFKSIDGGQTWQSKVITSPSSGHSAIHAYSFSPNFASDKTVFAATGGGLFKSTDGGESWQWLSRAYSGEPAIMSTVAVAPNYTTSGLVLAGGGWGGLFTSRDGGINWTSNYSLSAVSIAYSPKFATDQIAFIAANGVYKTWDGALTWTRMLTYPVSMLALSPRFGDDKTLWTGGGNTLYISSNEGSGWISRTIAAGNVYLSALVVSPGFQYDHTLFAGTNAGLYRTTDGGLSWSPVASFPNIAVLSLAISPGWPGHAVMLAGTLQGVYRTADGGATWARMQGFTTLSIGPIALSPDESMWFAGSEGMYASADKGHAWNPIGLQGGVAMQAAISPDYANDETLFAVWDGSPSIGSSIYRTTNRGATWQSLYTEDGVGSVAISPQYASDHTLFAASYGGSVVRSTNGGDNWTAVGTWPSGMKYGMYQVSLTPNYPADGTVFAGGSYGFWRLPSGSTNWQPAASGLLSNTTVLAIAVSPEYTTSHTLLAVSRWFSGAQSHYGMFRSGDSGLNWQPANAGLPDTELRDVKFSPNYATDQTAYALTSSQLYRSTDQGQTWALVGAPPGWPYLSHLAVSRSGQVIITSDAGVWTYTSGVYQKLVDGDFEAGNGWGLPATPRPAAYSSRVAHDGRQAMRIGIDAGGNVAAYSSAQQTVTLPISPTFARLSFRLYPVSGESLLAPPGGMIPSDAAQESQAHTGDAQYVLILNPATGAISQTLVWNLSNSQTWQRYTFDLRSFGGQTIVVHFGVYNDGADGQTAIYVDQASLIVLGRLPYEVYLPLIQNR